MPADLARRDGVELIRTGSWEISSGRWNATRADLVAAVAATSCPAIRTPRIKVGHTDTRFTPGDGEPAIGRVENLRLADQGHTLLGDYVGVPGWLNDVMASAYPDRSVEGTYNYRCGSGHTHPFVLTAVALLGVTPPGVATLRSLDDVKGLYGLAAALYDGGGVRIAASIPGVLAADPRPGDGDGDRLKRWWLYGPGLKRWATKPHPWTALYREMKDHMPDAMAKRVASSWYHEHFGRWPGQKHGKVAAKFDPSQRRDRYGKWATVGGGFGDTGNGVDGAVADLMAGRHATVKPEQVRPLMAALTDKQTNLMPLKIHGPGNGNLYRHVRDIPRSEMPQLPVHAEQLRPLGEKLNAAGVDVKFAKVDPRTLVGTQSQLDSAKVSGMFQKVLAGQWKHDRVLIVSREGAILDGHHRWAASAAASAAGHPIKVNVMQVDMDIDSLLELGRSVSTVRNGLFDPDRHSVNAASGPGSPPPDPDQPWMWIAGRWVLIASDTADGIPESLDDLPAQSGGEVKAKFNPDQRRDRTGKWTKTGGAGSAVKSMSDADLLKTKPWAGGERKTVYSDEAELAAFRLLQDYATIEPNVTPTLGVFAQRSGARMEGLDFKLKTQESLARKLEQKSATKGLTPDQYAKKIGDALRYTMVTRDDNYGSTAQSVVDDFRKEGYQVDVENTWGEGGTYKGINTNISRDGLTFELQFHTDSSLSTKMDQHDLYEQARDKTVSPEVRAKATAQMLANTEALPTPTGAVGVK